jgi:hypothetical protein
MHDLSLHLLDIVQNSIKANAHRINVTIEALTSVNRLRLSVCDDGCGMSAEMLSQVTDPFVTTRTTRKVGLGLPLLKEHCELTGGQLTLESQPGCGTSLHAELGIDSIDRLPLGDLGATWSAILVSNPTINYSLTLRAQDREEVLDTVELRLMLDDVPLSDPNVLNWIREYVAEKQQNIFGGVLHEIIS